MTTKQLAVVLVLVAGSLAIGAPALATEGGADRGQTQGDQITGSQATQIHARSSEHSRPLDRRHRKPRGRSGRWW